MRSLYRDDGLRQPEIARRLGRHKSWVCRRLMLVEALDPAVQADVRLGLLAPRAAAPDARLPRGNQRRAADRRAPRPDDATDRALVDDSTRVRERRGTRGAPRAPARNRLRAQKKCRRAALTRRPKRSSAMRSICAESRRGSKRGCWLARSQRSVRAPPSSCATRCPDSCRCSRARAHHHSRGNRGVLDVTATWRSREELAHQVVTLATQGLARRAIARALGVSRNTVQPLLAAHAARAKEEHTALPDAAARRAARPR